MAKVRLKADMQKSKESEDAVDRSITCWVIQSSSNKDVLDSLQEFHCEEKENTTGELSVASSSINPPKTHLSDKSKPILKTYYHVAKRPRAAKPADISPVKHILSINRC